MKLPSIKNPKDLLECFLFALMLLSEAGNGPCMDLDPGVKLLPSHVPHTLSWYRKHPTTLLLLNIVTNLISKSNSDVFTPLGKAAFAKV